MTEDETVGDGITASVDMRLSQLGEIAKHSMTGRAAVHGVAKPDMT